MMGMDMMIKNVLGVDPEELKQQAMVLKEQAELLIGNAQERLTALEMRIDVIGKNQVAIYNTMQEILNRLPEKIAPVDTQLAIEEKNDDNGKLN